MEPIAANLTVWWSEGEVDKSMIVICQQILPPIQKGIWSNLDYVLNSHTSLIAFQLTIILITSSLTYFLLQHLRMMFISRILAGVIIGSVYGVLGTGFTKFILPPPILYTMRSFAFFGITLHAFMLGVETNRKAISFIGKKSIAIGFAGLITSVAFSYGAIRSMKKLIGEQIFNSRSTNSLAMFHATNFLMVTCSHLNDLGISNSEIGYLAASASVVLDVFGMIASFVIFNLIIPFTVKGSQVWKPFLVIGYYLVIFFVCRPLTIYIINKTPEGKPMRQTHFLLIILIVLVISFLGEIVDERFATFLFAFSLPEEPLSSILAERLDVITSGVFFPIFCAECGMQADVSGLDTKDFVTEAILLSGYVGKFLGTLISSAYLGHPFRSAMALSIIMSSKGLLDMASLNIWKNRLVLNTQEYTVSIVHVLVLTGALVPTIRYFYIPSKQYTTILRQSVIESHQGGRQSRTFKAVACIYKVENTLGVVRLLEICHPTQTNLMIVVVLQLLQQTGRCAMPIMAPLYQIASSSAFRNNLTRCNHVVNTFLHLERETKGYTRLQHYVAVAPYEAMHYDICKLAYEKSARLLILPFHVRWGADGIIEDSSTSIREVNKLVLQKAPCSVGVLVDRGLGSQLRISEYDEFKIAMLFIGGPDDHEALAYCRILTNHPNVHLIVISLKQPEGDGNSWPDLDDEVMTQFRNRCRDNKRISFMDVVVKDGADTTSIVVSIKDVVDLVIVGKHHDPQASALYCLTMDGWTDYPELGILGDMLTSSDFSFSFLVVQQEPQDFSLECNP